MRAARVTAGRRWCVAAARPADPTRWRGRRKARGWGGLRRGREFVLDGGDPLARREECAVAGEGAVIDLDAALGRGSNAELIREMVRRTPCRVGGGIRDLAAARAWLDAGAAKIM